jgi:hypothetical protein
MSRDLHPDWDSWTDEQRSRFMEAHRRNQAKREKWIKLLQHRAKVEKFTPGRLEYRPYQPPAEDALLLTDGENLDDFELDESPDPDQSMYVARVLYGPLVGNEVSSINIYKYNRRYLERRFRLDEENEGDLVDSAQQLKGGPRQFLWTLFNLIGRYHGDCVIYMHHNGDIIRVDKDDFEAWARSAQKDPVTALTQVRNLLPDRNHHE